MSTSARMSSWSAAAPASPGTPNSCRLWKRRRRTEMLGVEVPKRIAIDREGRVTDERPLRQVLTSWDRLQRLLRATIDEAHYHSRLDISNALIRTSAACASSSPADG